MYKVHILTVGLNDILLILDHLSTSIRTRKVRKNCWTVLSHMGIRFDRRIPRHLHQITPHNLAIRKSRVICLTFLRNFPISVENSQSIDILRSHLGPIYFGKHSPSSIDRSNKGRTDIRLTITILPPIFLNNGHQISHCQISLCHNDPDFRQFPVFSLQPLVQSLSKYSIDRKLPQSFEVAKHRQYKISIQ